MRESVGLGERRKGRRIGRHALAVFSTTLKLRVKSANERPDAKRAVPELGATRLVPARYSPLTNGVMSPTKTVPAA